METLHIRLLGDFRLSQGNERIETVNTPRLHSLLAYLLLHRHAPQSRHQLAFQFWPDSSEKQAHTNLRKLLFQLRNALPAPDHFLNQDHLNVQWRPEAPFILDVAELERALARCISANGRMLAHIQPAELTQVVSLYQGELLPSCLDEWILPLRQQLQQRVMQVLEELIERSQHQQEYRAGINYARHLLGLDPLHERAHQQLMQLYALNGERVAALHHYHTCTNLFKQELGVEPDEETQTLYQRILHMEGQATGSAAKPFDTSLIGRTNEWRTLLSVWQQVQRRQAHFLSIGGEAGIGKTRLAEELMVWASAQGMRTARTRSYEAEGGLAYGPVTEWLRAPSIKNTLKKLDKLWLSDVARLLPELLSEHANLTPPAALSEGWQRQRFFEALARAILIDKSPLLLLIDDLQWCDSETLAWLRFLLRFDPQARLLILGTWRSESVTAEHPLPTLLRDLGNANQLTTLELTALSAGETAELAQQLATRQIAAPEMQELYRLTEGHPLFVVETVRARGEQGVQSLPPKVQHVIQTRLAHLSAEAHELAGLAATIGRRFTLAVLTHASQQPEETFVRALDELWQRRIVCEVGADDYDFTHDRIREAATQLFSSVRRRLLHRRVAEALERVHAAQIDEVSAQLATHYEHAGQLDQAMIYWRRASERAVAKYAQRDAIHYLSRVLALLPSTEQAERYRLLLTRVKLYNHEAMRPEGKADLDALAMLVETLDDGTNAALRRRAEVALCMADYRRGVADQEQTSAAMQAAALAEQCGDEALMAQAYFFWAEANLNDTDALVRLRKALTLAHSAGLLQIEAEGLSLLGLHGIYSGVPLAELAAVLQQSLAVYQRLRDPAGQAGALGMLAYIIYTQREGNYELAIRYCEQALELVSDGWDAERFAKGNLGCLWYFLGDYARAKPYLEEELAIVQAVQHWGGEAGSRLELGLLHQAMGDDGMACLHLERAYQLMRDNNGTQQYRVKIEGQLALFYQRIGEPARAALHAEAAIHFANKLSDPRVQGDAFTRCARVWSDQGKLVEATEFFQQALICYQQMEQYNHTTMPLVGLAEIALRQNDPDQAQALLEQLLHHLQTHQLDRTEEDLYVYMTGYRALQALNDPGAARLLQLAYEQLQVCAASLQSEHDLATFWAAPQHAEVRTALSQRG
ncbi:MAG: AAA family ATPase [Caldilineaceae bacterium]